jgi:hypothetical protein
MHHTPYTIYHTLYSPYTIHYTHSGGEHGLGGRRISCIGGMVRGIEQAYIAAIDATAYQTALAVSGCQNSGVTGSKKWKAICGSMDGMYCTLYYTLYSPCTVLTIHCTHRTIHYAGDTTLRCIQETYKAMSDLMHSHFLLVQVQYSMHYTHYTHYTVLVQHALYTILTIQYLYSMHQHTILIALPAVAPRPIQPQE